MLSVEQPGVNWSDSSNVAAVAGRSSWFTNIPAEIRQSVYQELFRASPIGLEYYRVDEATQILVEQNAISILLANKVLHKEAMPYFLRETKFILGRTSLGWTKDPRPSGPLFRRLRHIELPGIYDPSEDSQLEYNLHRQFSFGQKLFTLTLGEIIFYKAWPGYTDAPIPDPLRRTLMHLLPCTHYLTFKIPPTHDVPHSRSPTDCLVTIVGLKVEIKGMRKYDVDAVMARLVKIRDPTLDQATYRLINTFPRNSPARVLEGMDGPPQGVTA